MAQITYGSITLVDITDVGQLSVIPTSNMPLSIIYDPDQNIYTPDWSVTNTNLVLTPTIYYNNTVLTASSPGVTITWKRREGAGNITSLTTGQTKQTNGNLKVTVNKFTPSSTMISYIVTVTYVQPETQTSLTAEGQITFSLVKLASSAKMCIISGDSVFKYNTNGTLVSASSIVLTAKTNNVNISAWQYKKSDGTWETYPNSGTGDTLTVKATDTVFINDSYVTIQLVTNDENVFDIHTITKLRDGAPGTNTITAVLSNEDQMIPFPNNGSPDYSQAVSQIYIYNGGTLDTANWTINTTASDNLTISRSTTVKTNDTVAVTGMTGQSGTVTFTCTRSNYANIIKTFSVVKVAQGADAHEPEIYSIECSAIAINKTTPSDGSAVTYTPSSVVVTAYKQVGNGTRATYAGRIKITSGSTSIHSTSTNESTYTITSSDIAKMVTNGYMTVELYQAGGTSILLDKQTIILTADGAKGQTGETGAAGVDAINVILGNYADIIPCTSESTPKTIAAMTIDIPFTAYKGITQVACTFGSLPTLLGKAYNATNASSNPSSYATASAAGHIKYTIPKSTAVSAASGTLLLTFTCEGQTITHEYSWSRSVAATNGVNAKLFELYAPNGNIFTSRESQDLIINGRLMDGSTDKTSSATNWVWSKWANGAYSTIDGATTSSLTVNNSTVDGYASYKCECKYKGTSDTATITYTAYYALIDKLDPIQAAAFCSLGGQIVNKQGVGAFYVIVTDTGTGQELDALKTDKFLTAAPANPTAGDYYYHLNSTNKTVTLKKYSGSAWADAPTSDLPTGDYTWSFRDGSGKATMFNGSLTASGKVIYVDGTLVTKKIIADVKVQI